MTATKLCTALACIMLAATPVMSASPPLSKGKLTELGTMIGLVSLCEDEALIKRGQANLLMHTFKASLDRASYKTLSSGYGLARRTHTMFIAKKNRFVPFLMGACSSGEEFAANVLSLRK